MKLIFFYQLIYIFSFFEKLIVWERFDLLNKSDKNWISDVYIWPNK